jgi:5-methyltetrahydrofolate--homocysteine methyltransferase
MTEGSQVFLCRLAAGDLLLADGATGTGYQAMGLAIGVAPEQWVEEQPDRVLELHRAFLDAGADIILTDSFGGTSLRLRDTPLAGRVSQVNRRAAEMARHAASARDGALVAGSMGPTGMLMEPLGDLTASIAAEVYAEQAGALAEGGVDLLLLETFFALDEARAAIEGVKRVTDLPLVVSFSFDQGVRTMMGVSPAQMVAAMTPLGVAAIGANCGRSLEDMDAVLSELVVTKTGIPLWIKPNAGLPRMDGDRARYDTSPETMGEYAARFIGAGARIVGGCCGTSAEHLASIARSARAAYDSPSFRAVIDDHPRV